jgi:hypothetical protein
VKSRRNLHYYIKTDPTFPVPLYQIGKTMLWTWPEVEEWAATKSFQKRTPPIHPPRSADFQLEVDRVAAEHGLDPEDLAGSYEIAHRLGFERTMMVHRLMRDRESGFPKAVSRINPGRSTWIWWWPDVERWAEANRPDRIKAWREVLAEHPLESQTVLASREMKPTTTKKRVES